HHPHSFIKSIHAAYEHKEYLAAIDGLAPLLLNSRMSAVGHRPLCQDTVIVTLFCKVGQQVTFDTDMSLTDMINEAARRAYSHPDNILRASVLADPDGKPHNTKDNKPALLNYDIV